MDTEQGPNGATSPGIFVTMARSHQQQFQLRPNEHLLRLHCSERFAERTLQSRAAPSRAALQMRREKPRLFHHAALASAAAKSLIVRGALGLGRERTGTSGISGEHLLAAPHPERDRGLELPCLHSCLFICLVTLLFLTSPLRIPWIMRKLK
ncbi:unnamed protein product [Pleuronectes platessa]|uniref:Uncharacterized protein n=1 Tax=Pleuronectes platessa TaxID=8262 RepID=A0A9N7ZEM1_PLEPL|nr:unnamed protein product [Pleuronectes platessa]